MHYLVRLLVKASDAEEARDRASHVMERLVELHEFDWYQTGAEDCRWPECWQPKRLTSVKGQAWVAEAMREQFVDFLLAMKKIRVMMSLYTDKQIFNEEIEQTEDFYLSRWQFSKASGYHANTCQLFDNTGFAIINQTELDGYLENPEHLWVVQVDAHN